MRQILIDHARKRLAEKRGGGQARVAFADDMAATRDDVDVLDLDEALLALHGVDARKARVVELRFFTGLDQDAIAEVLGIARSTVAEDWRFARAWLLARLQSDPAS
jgi:RNA polymerase sigma factor (TIGR02999 family)